MIQSRSNFLKYEVLSCIFDKHLTSYEVSILTFGGADYTTKEFENHLKKTDGTLYRISKPYNPAQSYPNCGYKIPHATRRYITSHKRSKEAHSRYEYKATPKGRRFACECHYRLHVLGHTSLKWDGRYYLPRNECGGKCDVCPMRQI